MVAPSTARDGPIPERHARKQRRVRPTITSHTNVRPLSFGRVGVEWRKRGVGAHLIHGHKALLVYLLGDHHPPGAPQELVSFCRSHSPFFRLKPRRFNHRRMVGSLTLSPVRCSRKRRLSLTVAAGRSLTSSSSSLLALL